MARKKTKKQKRASDSRKKQVSVKLNDSGVPVITTSEVKPKSKNTTTQFSQSQVSLLYRDLLKTVIVTVVVFAVLLFIFVYMR